MNVAGETRISVSLALALVCTPALAEERSNSDYPSRVYWGDTHVHTYLSGDAFTLGTRLTPDDAYRFAKGEAVTGTGSQEAQLRRPLDFLLIADHAENLGVLPSIVADDELLPDSDARREWAPILKELGTAGDVLDANTVEEFRSMARPLLMAKKSHGADYELDDTYRTSVWQAVVAAAESHNVPGAFTTFVGYEWSGSDGAMIHRNVLFADGPDKTGKVLPFSAFDSNDVEDLWASLKAYEEELGGSVISIPHNGNMSRGAMFKLRTYSDEPLTREYAIERARWEPVYEVTQIKGDGETHPQLSPDDEFADFETWPPAIFGGGNEDEQSNYARSALQLGLQQEADLGANPFKFGMIGSTDSHTALATADEDMYWGKMGLQEPNPYRASEDWFYSASGYAAVWAQENTRESLFAAMKRREIYASTGPRITVRFFGGWSFEAGDEASTDFAGHGYRNGVPMGGDLARAPDGDTLTFLVRAAKDPLGANLDRIQVVKGWRDPEGGLHEQVFDVAGADGSDAGHPELGAVWIDPDFDAEIAAFYYARVIEVTTPRWTAYDAERYGIEELPPEVAMTVQDRAYTSPIWYTP